MNVPEIFKALEWWYGLPFSHRDELLKQYAESTKGLKPAKKVIHIYENEMPSV